MGCFHIALRPPLLILCWRSGSHDPAAAGREGEVKHTSECTCPKQKAREAEGLPAVVGSVWGYPAVGDSTGEFARDLMGGKARGWEL